MKKVDVHIDILSEILLRLDPSSIFGCILVSKEWLDVIASHYFRREYLKRWKDNLKAVIGIMGRYRKLGLMWTNKLGSQINERVLANRLCCELLLLASSGDGLLFCSDERSLKLYIVNLATNGRGVTVTPLPPLAVALGSSIYAHITSEECFFKVVLVKREGRIGEETKCLSLQTFCSSEWKWEKSEFSCCRSFRLTYSKIVSSKGVVYFPARRGYADSVLVALVAYDSKNQRISLIMGPILKYPFNLDHAHYEITPEDNFLCVIIHRDTKITMWELNQENCKWNVLFTFEPPIWSSSTFVSFVPGRSDSIFVNTKMGKDLYIYNGHTQQLEKYDGSNKDSLSHMNFNSLFLQMSFGITMIPITIADSGVWPSPPFSNHRINTY